MITRDRIRGAAVIVAIATALCFFRAAAPAFFSGTAGGRPPYSDGRTGEVIVALSGETQLRGVFYIPRGTTVKDFLNLAGVPPDRIQDGKVLGERLKTASVVVVRPAAGPLEAPAVTVGRMDASMRFALDLPMDLNSTSARELELVPGIGEKTALRIIDYRREAGGFRKVSDLKNIRGIKEKKYASIRRYFSVE